MVDKLKPIWGEDQYLNRIGAKVPDISTPIFFIESDFYSLSIAQQFYELNTTSTKKYKKQTASAEYLKKNLSIDTTFDPC